jgi:hypothetical protein
MFLKNDGKFGMGLMVLTSILAAIVFCAVVVYSYINGLRNQRVDFETRLPAQYLANQSYLSSFIGGFYELIGVANVKSDKIDKILTDAVKGRYEQSGGYKTMESALFSAIKEAYPDLSGLNIYDKAADYVTSHRVGYQEDQTKLLDMLRAYDKWRNTGMVSSWVIKNILGTPTDDLVATIGENKIKGQAALDKMYTIVLVEGTAEAYKTGVMKALRANDVK